MGMLLLFDSLFGFYCYSFTLVRTVFALYIYRGQSDQEEEWFGFTLRLTFSVSGRYLNVISCLNFLWVYFGGCIYLGCYEILSNLYIYAL